MFSGRWLCATSWSLAEGSYGESVERPVSGNKTSTMKRLKPIRTIKPIKNVNAYSFVLLFQLLLKYNHCCVFSFLNAAKKKQIGSVRRAINLVVRPHHLT